MITISRALAKQLKTVLRRALGINARSPTLSINLVTNSSGIFVRASTHDVAIEYHADGKFAEQAINIPFQLLADCEGRLQDPVEIEGKTDGRITASWTDNSVPVVLQYDQPNSQDNEFPVAPDLMVENPAKLIQALRDAADTANQEAVRYATNMLQLRGGSGSIAATDGRQLLIQNGFEFPWEEAVLVPRTSVFGCRELAGDEPVFVGRTEKYVNLRTGPWAIHLAIDLESRFPNVDDHVAKPEAAIANVKVSEADAAFLGKAVKRLPGDAEPCRPLTVDLNGHVALRARPADQEQVTELLLTGSSSSGQDVCLQTDRRYLARALKLGFRELQVLDAKAPLLCRDDARTYVWAPLEASTAIKASKNAIRIESPAEAQASESGKPKSIRPKQEKERKNAMPRTKAESNGHAGSNGAVAAVNTDNLIAEAEAVKTSLREAVNQTTQLIAALKRQRKQSKVVRSTLASLRQLQAMDA